MLTAQDATIIERLNSLIEVGEALLGTEYWDEERVDVYLDYGRCLGWATRVKTFFNGVSSAADIYAKQFQQHAGGNTSESVGAGLEILRSLKADIEAGYLTTIRELIHATRFSDYLGMAEYPLSEGYKDAAAVIVGSTLEVHLRQLCEKHNIEIEVSMGTGSRPKKADQMNADLWRNKAYSVLVQKQVTAWLDLRNKAAHGKYSEYTVEQVDFCLREVRNFITTNPA